MQPINNVSRMNYVQTNFKQKGQFKQKINGIINDKALRTVGLAAATLALALLGEYQLGKASAEREAEEKYQKAMNLNNATLKAIDEITQFTDSMSMEQHKILDEIVQQAKKEQDARNDLIEDLNSVKSMPNKPYGIGSIFGFNNYKGIARNMANKIEVYQKQAKIEPYSFEDPIKRYEENSHNYTAKIDSTKATILNMHNK